MNQLLIILLLFTSLWGFSQKPKTIFLDNNMEVTDRGYATFYQVNFVVKDSIKHGPSTTFYMTSEKYMEGIYLDNLKQGEFKYYFKNGNLWKSENYLEGELSGDYSEWYENGDRREVGYVQELDYHVKDYWDSEGNQLTSDGNGKYVAEYENGILKETGLYTDYEKDSTWVGYYENSNKYYEEHYLNGQLESGTSYDPDGLTYYYYKIIEPTNLDVLHKAIIKKIKFISGPNSGKIRGEVVVQFVLTKKGKIVETELIRSLGIGYDAEVLSAMKSLSRKQFEPEKYRGQPQSSQITVPIAFNSN